MRVKISWNKFMYNFIHKSNPKIFFSQFYRHTTHALLKKKVPKSNTSTLMPQPSHCGGGLPQPQPNDAMLLTSSLDFMQFFPPFAEHGPRLSPHHLPPISTHPMAPHHCHSPTMMMTKLLNASKPFNYVTLNLTIQII